MKKYKSFFFNSVLFCSVFAASNCGVEPKKPIPRPAPELPPAPLPIPKPLPEPPKKEPEPEPIPVESCVNGQTYGVEQRQSPLRGMFYVAKCDGYKPVVVGNNGTSAPSLYYRATAQHLASKGFIVIWPENQNTGSGRSCMAGLELGLKQHDALPNHYAILGHSQGGSATLACGGLAERKYPDYKAALLPNEAACGMSQANIKSLAGSIDQKVLFFSGDRDTVVRESWVKQCYQYVKADKAWIVGRGATHFNTQNYIPELALNFFRAALFDHLESWKSLNEMSSRKYRWKNQFDNIGE